MQVEPINVTGIIAVIMGISVILIPVAGLTVHFALKPLVGAFARVFEHRGLEETVGIMDRRMELIEAQVESMDAAVNRIAEAVEFDRQLVARRAPALPAPEAPDG